jgi:hypothetical protein
MKQKVILTGIFFLLFLESVYTGTISHNGLEIEVSFVESDINVILEFQVQATNTTNKGKTLLGTIYLDTKQYPGLDKDEAYTPVYLELPASGTAEETFFLVTSMEIPSPEWYFVVDQVYDFIINDTSPGTGEKDTSTRNSPGAGKEEEENEMFSITGTWVMEKKEDSQIYGNWVWVFNQDGTVFIEEILGAEARLPVTYEGSYTIKGNQVTITLFAGNPFPGSFLIQDRDLVADQIILKRDPGL